MRRNSFGILATACAALALAVSSSGSAGPKGAWPTNSWSVGTGANWEATGGSADETSPEDVKKHLIDVVV